MFETVTCGIIDMFPQQLTDKRVLVNVITGVVFFLLGLPLTFNVSNYICFKGVTVFYCLLTLFKLNGTDSLQA